MCANLQDLAELQQLIDPSAVPSPDALTVCALEVPSKQEVVEVLRSAPGQAWAAARDALPTVSAMRKIDITEIDWQELASAGREGATTAANGLDDATTDTVRWLQRWWADKD